MTTELTLDGLAQDIRQRLDAIKGELSSQVADERIKQLIQAELNAVLADPDSEIVRKIRFGPDADPNRKLVGTRYARWGLSIADVEWLYDVQNSLRGMPKKGGGVHEGPSEELERTFQAISDAVYLSADQVYEIDRAAIDDLFPRLPLTAFHGEDRTLAAQGKWELTGAYKRAIQAMDTAESGYGQQLVGAGYVGELWEAPRRLGRVFPLIESFEMRHPTEYLPVEVDIPEMIYVAENVANNSGEYGTVKTGSNRVQVDARKFLIHQIWSGEMDEDSLIPFVPFIRRQAGLSIAHYADSLVLNGDTTATATGNINSDDAAPASTKHYLAFDGIRHAALVDNSSNATDAGGSLSLERVTRLRRLMVDRTRLHDWGHPTDPDDLVYVADTDTADALSELDEVLTADKYGAQATIFNGELATIGRHRLISSMAVPLTEADGKASGNAANNTKGQVIAFNRRGFAVGWRRRVMVETERLPARDQTRIVYSLRLGFGRFTPTGSASGLEAAAVLYNI